MDFPDWKAILQGLLSNTNLSAIIVDNLNFNNIAQELVSKTNLIAIIKTEIKRERDAENLAQCKKYAVFMWSLSRAKGETAFWSMLVLIICLLSVSTIMYDKTWTHSKEMEEDEGNSARAEHTEMNKRKNNQCLLISAICFFVSGIAFAFQLLAYHDIYYCHREALAHLYMPVLVVLSFGSVIAILGVSVAQMYILLNEQGPPFATALGTPVLVICSTVHLAVKGTRWLRDWYRVKKEEKEAVEMVFSSRTVSQPSG